ncbi:MAG: imidazoleglycerol-phosphate dehydratase HisB [Asticcacaulis sp.]
MLNSPFSPLVAGSPDLNQVPPPPKALTEALANRFGAPFAQTLAVRGADHGLELVFRRMRLHGYDNYVADGPETDSLMRLGEIYAQSRQTKRSRTTGFQLIQSPRWPDGTLWDLTAARTLANDIFPAWLVIDARYADSADTDDLMDLIRTETNVVILRSLGHSCGLMGAEVGALFSTDKIVFSLEKLSEPNALARPLIKAAEAALDPSRRLILEQRLQGLRQARRTLTEALSGLGVPVNIDGQAPWLYLTPDDKGTTLRALERMGVGVIATKDGLVVPLGTAADNARILAAFAPVEASVRPARRAEVLRDTKETKIAVSVDLDQPGPVQIHTGIGFFDHMLDQVASHGGFALSLSCSGDLHIDLHHSLEDCMLAFGTALKQALGERLGLARFGFVLPMDETEASVSVDLGGRPFCVFDGTFKATHLGDYPTEMTAHAFRSLSETLSAAIHVKVTGENDHHKTEACFKALGRALRMALRTEGEALPSTKGMLA